MAREPNLSDFAEEFKSLGAKPEHIRRIWCAWLGLGSWTPPQNVQFPARLREALPDVQRRLESLVRFDRLESQQKDAGKLLVHLADGECVEAVLLPRQAVCISTQVGCAVGCVFCMTGRCGLIRQLSSAEIVAQVVAARRIRPDIKKVVFMGMGEPSHNLKAVMEAVEFFETVLHADVDSAGTPVEDKRTRLLRALTCLHEKTANRRDAVVFEGVGLP